MQLHGRIVQEVRSGCVPGRRRDGHLLGEVPHVLEARESGGDAGACGSEWTVARLLSRVERTRFGDRYAE